MGCKDISDAYKNLSENGADRYRAVGRGRDCSVKIETNADLYRHYVESLEMAVKAMEKQTPKKRGAINPEVFKYPVCKKIIDSGYNNNYCKKCGQRLKGQ